MIGHRLKISRSAAGLSLRGLEERIGNRVTAQAIGKYERNESMPSSGVLIALAEALNVPIEYLVGEQDMALEGVEFRKKKITSKRDEAKVEGQVLYRLERYLLVEELLNLPSINFDQPREAPYPVVNDPNEADRAARYLRDHWGLGLNPIPNLSELFEERGIKVLSIDHEKIDGLTAKVRRKNGDVLPVIVINETDWAERKRFNLAHELGHMVLAVSKKVNEEKAAHRFAGAFLLPAEALWAEIGKHRNSISIGELLRLKELFGASIQAITYRCKDLGIFGPSLFRHLFETYTQRGWRSPPFKEAGALPPGLEEPKRLERLCFRALAEGVISEAKTAELLDISVHELSSRVDAMEEFDEA